MFDVPAVQRIAMELGYFETVIWIEENKGAYCRFIMYGDEGIAGATGTAGTEPDGQEEGT